MFQLDSQRGALALSPKGEPKPGVMGWGVSQKWRSRKEHSMWGSVWDHLKYFDRALVPGSEGQYGGLGEEASWREGGYLALNPSGRHRQC